MSPTVNNPTADGLEVPAPALHETQAIVIPPGGGVVVTPEQAHALKDHPILKVKFETGDLIVDDDGSSLGEEETEAQHQAIAERVAAGESADVDGEVVQTPDESQVDGDSGVDESDAGDGTETKPEGE